MIRNCLTTGVLSLSALVLSACITQPRSGPPPAPFDAVVPGFDPDIRYVGFNPDYVQINEDVLARLKKSNDGSLDFLALSGGGAGGSFGAGLLVGLTELEDRPQFEVVTGVSTGALIAPFAFLGSEWDDELQDAFAGETASELLKTEGIGIFYRPSFFKPEPLRNLVDQYVTDELVSAVATEAEKGRVLLVATTNLDRQLTTYWNMGEIALKRDARARELFRDILVASASVPGVFPPVMLDVEANGETYQEMHVDGSATVPFFLGPELMSLWSDPIGILDNANLYIIMNGPMKSPSSMTKVNTIEIVSKAFDTMLIFGGRSAIGEYAALSAQHNMNFSVAFIPPDLAFGGSLDFDQNERERLFQFARTCARQDLIWFEKERLADALLNSSVNSEDLDLHFGIPENCPTQPAGEDDRDRGVAMAADRLLGTDTKKPAE